MNVSGSVRISVDPVTLVSQECIKIISEIRKNSRFFQSGVAAILSSSDTINLFNDEFMQSFKSLKLSDGKSSFGESVDYNKLVQFQTQYSTHFGNSNNDPILAGFLQLKTLLSEIDKLNEIETLTVLQPYFMLISSPSTSGLITSITLTSLTKLFEYDVLFHKSNLKDPSSIKTNINQLIHSLTHTQFESLDPTLDDSVLLKVLDLVLRIVRNNSYNCYITNEIFFQVIQVNLALACNKKRSEVLRRYAEQALDCITMIAFSKLSDTQELAVDHKFYYQYLASLVTIISVENQYYHTESTKIFVVNLLSTIVETSGSFIPHHPALLKLVKNQLFKNLLTIILKNDSLNLLQAALQCFISLNLILSQYLPAQLEFAYENIFKSILPADDFNHLDESIDENTNPDLTQSKDSAPNAASSTAPSRTGTPIAVLNTRNPLAKEVIIESLSLLWSHSSELLINLFINFDCKFDSKNISLIFIKFLNKLAESSSAAITTNNVPPLCLEGLLQFINGLNMRVKNLKRHGIVFDATKFEANKILKMKARKEEFLRTLNILNNVDFKTGLAKLRAQNFLSEDQKELAEFFYYKANLLNKKNVGEFITKQKNLPLLIDFLSFFDFRGKRVDEALRLLLQKFRIPGESQQIERVVEHFADKYVSDQDYTEAQRNHTASMAAYKEGRITKEPVEPVVADKDAVFILSYAIIMLNTDLHNPKVKEHMSFADFQKNLRGVYQNGKDYPEWYLRSMYNSIKAREIIIPEEHYGTDKWFTGSWDLLMNSSSNSQKTFRFAFEKNIVEPSEDQSEFEKIRSGTTTVKDIDPVIVSQFDKILFERSFSMLLKSFVHVFEETGDDSRVAKLMSTIDKCANIANYYRLDGILDVILNRLAALTTLTGEKQPDMTTTDDEFIRASVPLTRVKLPFKKTHENASDTPPLAPLASVVSNESAIYGSRKNAKTETVDHGDEAPQVVTVSETSVWFGRDFKAQISFVALFNIIRKNNFTNFSKAWQKIVVIILKLYENCILDGNFFNKFQLMHHLQALPPIKPIYVVDKTKKVLEETEVSLFSAFTSYLKINSDEPPEPTNEEMEATLSTVSCVEQSKVATLFATLMSLDQQDVNWKDLILSFLKATPSYSKTTRQRYLNVVLFLYEAATALAMAAKDKSSVLDICEKIIKEIDRLVIVNEKNSRKLFSQTTIARLMSYQLVLINNVDDKFENSGNILKRSIELLLTIDKATILESYANTLVPQLKTLATCSENWKYLVVIHSEDYWKLLRSIASLPKHVHDMFSFLQELVNQFADRIVPENYMFVLGLFDEISLIGAIGSTFEQEMSAQKSKELPDTNPHADLIELSIQSIDLTCRLKDIVARKDFVDIENKTQTSCWYALIQALGHQTFNPCRMVRGHALKVFTSNLLSFDFEGKKFITARGIFELDIFPLVTELLKDEVLYCDFYGMKKTKSDVLSSITKIYLQYLNKSYIIKEDTYTEESELSFIWLTLLDVFKSLIYDEKKQVELQLKKKLSADKSVVIKEASKELIKNSLLYMQDCGYLKVGDPNHQFLWDETWKKVAEVYPELKNEFAEELKEIEKNEKLNDKTDEGTVNDKIDEVTVSQEDAIKETSADTKVVENAQQTSESTLE